MVKNRTQHDNRFVAKLAKSFGRHFVAKLAKSFGVGSPAAKTPKVLATFATWIATPKVLATFATWIAAPKVLATFATWIATPKVLATFVTWIATPKVLATFATSVAKFHPRENRVRFPTLFALLVFGFFVLAMPMLSNGQVEPAILGDAKARSIAGLYGAVLPSEKVDLSVHREGLIAEIIAKPGDLVVAGQVVAKVDGRDFSLRKSLAEQELRKAIAIANDQSSLIIAKSQHAKAEATYNTNVKLKTKSELEVFRLQMDVRDKQAALEFALAKHEQDLIDAEIKKRQLEIANQDLLSCDIVSPIDGIVSKQMKYAGEAVRLGDTVLQIIQMNELLFRVELDLNQILPADLADYHAEAQFEFVRGEKSTVSNIHFDCLMPDNLDSRHYFATAVIQNSQVQDSDGIRHWLFRPGMSGELKLLRE